MSLLDRLFPCRQPAKQAAASTGTGAPVPPDRDAVVEANRRAWNHCSDSHRTHTYDKVIGQLAEKGHLLHPALKDLLEQVGISGRHIAVLSCNNGRAVMSLAKLGAARAVGFDLSEAFIVQGRTLVAEAGLECELIASDIYRIGHKHDGLFDMVVITPGSLIYYPDLPEAMAVMARLLKPGGSLVVHEIHPALGMFRHDEKGRIVGVGQSYFREAGPTVLERDYYSRQPLEGPPMYLFHHRLDAILQGCLGQRLMPVFFQERAEDVSGLFRDHPDFPHAVPRSFLLRAEKA